MKKNVLIILIVLCGITINAQSWMNSFEDAKKVAIASNKLVLVDFWAVWCKPCLEMDKNSWSKDEVKNMMSNFVSVKIDLDRNRSLAQKYNVRGIPNLKIMDGNGNVIVESTGYKNKKELLKWINIYSLDMSYVQNEMLAYYKKSNYANALRLGNKLQLYSIHLNGKSKKAFLNLANEYFNVAKKEVKKNKYLIDKIKLLKIRRKLFLGNTKKVLKKLEKINESNLTKANISLYSSLKYISLMRLNKGMEAKKWVDKINKSDEKVVNSILKDKNI